MKNQKRKLWLGEVADPNYPRYANPKQPQLLLGVAKSDPLKRIQDLNQGTFTKSKFSAFIKKFGLVSRMDLLEIELNKMGLPNNFQTKQEASNARKAIKAALLQKGYVLDPDNGANTFTTYVIDLQQEESKEKPSKWVYVGETSQTPEERFSQHKRGEKANNSVRDFGLAINYQLMNYFPQTHFKQDSLAVEKLAAQKLSDLGYKVEGGK